MESKLKISSTLGMKKEEKSSVTSGLKAGSVLKIKKDDIEKPSVTGGLKISETFKTKEEEKPEVTSGLKIKMNLSTDEEKETFQLSLRDGKLSLGIKSGTLVKSLGMAADQFDAARFLAECIDKYPESVDAINKYKAEHGIDMYNSKGQSINIKTPNKNEVLITDDAPESLGYKNLYTNQSTDTELSNGYFKYLINVDDGRKKVNCERSLSSVVREKLNSITPENFLIKNYINAAAQNNLDKLTGYGMKRSAQELNDAIIKQSSENLKKVRDLEKGEGLSI